MKWSEYVEWTETTAVYPKEKEVQYLTLGLKSESGELCGVLKREIRDGKLDRNKLMAEIGDCIWYLARCEQAGMEEACRWFSREWILTGIRPASMGTELCARFGFVFGDVIEYNVMKLSGRKERDVLQGEGDDR